MEERNFTVEGRIWITTLNGGSIGEGKILLLEKIHKLGSLRQASIEMKMSYQQAWNIINILNNQLEKPLVILKRGGKDGGKAEITDFGMEIISSYHNLQIQFKHFLNNMCDCPNH